jgi:hypothetical protein
MTELGVKVTARFIPEFPVRGGPTTNQARQEVYRIGWDIYFRQEIGEFTSEFCKNFKILQNASWSMIERKRSRGSLKGVLFLQFTQNFEHLGTVAFELSQQFFGIFTESRAAREKLEFLGIDSW